ncbi:GNAT family N-acetyltransferase [uncultured Algibacter sp.]|uniref:GNAT family N-acetyltransferase n=1 Tax=uncultured Algibacter sp. TaxID=298659 RepID=UPI002620B142|nr:GNAT family N-acetyltransferase [uncultured Algibacter sp.]
MITLKKVESKKDLKSFVKFPFKLYKDSKQWTPPIISEEINSFNKEQNPVFKYAETNIFLAYKNNEIVGRIVAIVNWVEVKEQKVKKMRFGWCDFIDDLEVSQALFNEVEKIGKSHNLEFLEGPVGFSNLDKVGVVTEGFDTIALMVTWYNHPYYAKHYEAAGYKVEKEYVETKIPFTNINKDVFYKTQDLIKRRYKLRALNFTKTSEVMPYVNEMFELFNQSYSSLPSFVPISNEQIEYFKKKFISFINPEYIKFVVDSNNELIGFAIVMPSFAKALQKSKGKLFPFGFTHILRAKKSSKDAVFYLIGVRPDFQNKGVHAIIFNEYHDLFIEKGIKMCYRTPELENNEAARKIWRHFASETYRKRKTFKKDIV